MDPTLAAQMAALSQYSTSKLIGGQTTTLAHTASAPAHATAGTSSAGPSSADSRDHSPATRRDSPLTSTASTMSASAAAATKTQRTNFLNSLAAVWVQLGKPLPPALTGAAHGACDPAWRSLEVAQGGEPGILRLSGHDLDLLDLYRLVINARGSQEVRAPRTPPARR
jgi:hypothetical protein